MTQSDLPSTLVRALVLYSLAEFQSGGATTLRVTLEGDCFSVADDGRGHPIDRSVEGTSYLKFIYSHFDYPFESGRCAPVQLQGIGMSLVNALCSELTLTVGKPDETLELVFRHGQLHASHRAAATTGATGITVRARLDPRLRADAAQIARLESWLQGLVLASPSLTLFFNGRELGPHR